MTFWIGVAARNHVKLGRAGGFAQLGHGKHTPVKSLKPGDWLAYYSPSTELGGGEKVQAFTALGRVTSTQAYQAQQGTDFHPWRVDVAYDTTATDAPIRPMLALLDLTRHRGPGWGMALRTSKIKGTEADLALIAAAMGVTLP